MALETVERGLLKRFAELLEYPRSGLVEAVRECEALVSRVAPPAETEGGGAVALLHEFRAFVEGAPLGQLEEVYSRIFDLDAACYPYVGYHLFGESYKRSVFLLGLKARYQAQGFAVPEKELPDHLAVMLRFLATTDDAPLAEEIIHEALLPALDRITGRAKSEGYEEEPSRPKEGRKQDHPYRGVLEALRLVLQDLS